MLELIDRGKAYVGKSALILIALALVFILGRCAHGNTRYAELIDKPQAIRVGDRIWLYAGAVTSGVEDVGIDCTIIEHRILITGRRSFFKPCTSKVFALADREASYSVNWVDPDGKTFDIPIAICQGR